jgi:ubiquinone/menaquinone biosynthesis C-methylase UbiE
MNETKVNPVKTENFADRMLEMLNSGALMIMTSIGHRTGLYDVMKDLPPSSSSQIAEAAGLNERYVREWLGAMVSGGIIDCDSEGVNYSLPVDHARWLTRDAAPDNIAVFAQYIPLLSTVEDKIIECFKNGGGVPYSGFPRFQQVMAEDSGQTVVAALLDSILPLVPGLVEALERGIDVLDVGCGSGSALILMARSFPNSNFAGYDITLEGISAAREEARAHGLMNIWFEIKDVTDLDPDTNFDLITAFDAIHDQARPDKVLESIEKVLKEDGIFLMQDIAASSYVQKNIDHPAGPLLYTISCMHCLSVSLAQNGAGLGAMWGEEMAREMLKKVGFTKVEAKKLPHDFQNVYYIIRKN